MFSQRLKELRKSIDITQVALAKKLFVSQQAVAKWEVGTATPNPDMLNNIASFFNVTTDYLLGRTDKKTPAPEIRDGKGKNLVRTIGRDGSYSERWLTDEQLEALQAIINQMPDVKDDF